MMIIKTGFYLLMNMLVNHVKGYFRITLFYLKFWQAIKPAFQCSQLHAVVISNSKIKLFCFKPIGNVINTYCIIIKHNVGY